MKRTLLLLYLWISCTSLFAASQLQLPFEENKKYNCQFEFQNYYEGLQKYRADALPYTAQMFYGIYSLNLDYTIYSGSWQNDRLTLIFVLENLVSNLPKFRAGEEHQFIRDTLTITINRKGEIIMGNPQILKDEFLEFLTKINPNLDNYYQRIHFDIFNFLAGEYHSPLKYEINNQNYLISYPTSSMIQLISDEQTDEQIQYSINNQKNRELLLNIRHEYQDSVRTVNRFNRPLVFNLNYYIKEIPEGLVRIHSKGKSLQEYQLYFTPAHSSLDSSLYIKYKSRFDDTIQLHETTQYNVWLFHEKTKTQEKHRIFLEPGSTLEVVLDDEANFPHLVSHFSEENQLATQIFRQFRENRIYNLFSYFDEKRHVMDIYDYYDMLETNGALELEFLTKNKHGLDPTCFEQLYWDAYFLYAYQILKLYGDRKFGRLDNEFVRSLKERVDTIQIYNVKAEKSPAYHRFLKEKFTQYHQEIANNRGESFRSRREIQHTTAYYLAQDYYDLYPRDYLMKEIVKDIIQDLEVDINTISHLMDDFNKQIKNTEFRQEIQTYFEKRNKLAVGSSLPSFMAYNAEGNAVLSNKLPHRHQLLIYDRNNALDMLNGKNFNQYSFSYIFNILVADPSQKIPIIYIVNNISKNTEANLSYLKDSLNLDIRLYQLNDQKENFNRTFSLAFAGASNVFPMLISPEHKILFLGNQSLISLHGLMQTLSKDHSDRRQKVIKWILGGGFILANLALLFFLYHELRTRYIRKEAEKKYADVQLKLQALRGQLNPHFLFNCLSTIRDLIEDRKSNQAIGYLEEFSDFVRIVLLTNKYKLITLAKELEFAKKYIHLEQMRFDFEVIFDVDVQLELSNIEVPPLILQPYIENAIKHGLSSQKNGLLKIQVHQEKDNVIIEIADNGCGFSNSPIQGNGVGLKLNSDRLNLIFDQRAEVIIENIDNPDTKHNGTKVLINIPIE